MKTTYLWLFAFVVPLVLTSCSEGEFNDMDRQTFIDGCIVDLEQGRSRVSQLENIKALIDAYGPSALCQESWTLLVKEATEDSYANYRKLSIKQAVEVAVIFRSTAYRGQKLFEEEMQKALELSRQKKDTQ